VAIGIAHVANITPITATRASVVFRAEIIIIVIVFKIENGRNAETFSIRGRLIEGFEGFVMDIAVIVNVTNEEFAHGCSPFRSSEDVVRTFGAFEDEVDEGSRAQDEERSAEEIGEEAARIKAFHTVNPPLQ
jgi:hypothetical protein